MNNALLYLGAFVVLVLAALFAVPTFIDWNGYRGTFEEQASRVLGRDVRVGGTVNVRLLPSPFVSFEKVRISDTGEASGEPFFRADSFKMWLAVPPLLRGVIEANEIELKKPVLRLAADSAGGGNWSTLSFAAGNLPFVPSDVTLEQVNIVNGVLSLNTAGGTELARIEGIDGELTSETLAGPFKFRGKAKWDDGGRDVRIATARIENSGDLRFKATVAVPDTHNTYVLDGRIKDLAGKPRLEGDLSATLLARKDATSRKDAEARGGLDLKGKVTGDATGVNLKDLVISVENAGPPQIVTGAAAMTWTDKIRVDTELASRWLDLDRAAGREGGARPTDIAEGLFSTLTGLLPGEAETNFKLRLDQVNLAGESVSNVDLAVVRAGGPLELKTFRARVPGGGRISLDGVLDVSSKPARLDGNLLVDAQSLVRFLSWALKSPGLGEGRTDGPLALSGRLHVADTTVALRNAQLAIGALPMRGDIELLLEARRRLSLSLEGRRIDWGQVFPRTLGLATLSLLKPSEAAVTSTAQDAAGTDAAPSGPKSADSRLFDLAQSDLRLTLKAGEVVDGDRVLRNVAARVNLEGDRLTAEELRFSTADGLVVDVAGETTSVRTAPSGTMRGTIEASQPAAVTSLFGLLDLAAVSGGSASIGDVGKRSTLEASLRDLAPFKLAGKAAYGVRKPSAFDIDADGIVQGGRMAANLAMDAGLRAWTSEPAELTVTLDGPAAVRAFAALGPSAEAALSTTQSGPRKLLLKASGVPEKGMVSIASLTGENFGAGFNGRVKIPGDTKPSSSVGTLQIAGDAREVLGLAGLPFSAGLSGVALSGELEVRHEGSALTLVSRKFDLGGSAVDGSVSLVSESGKPVKIAAKIDVDAAALPRLLAPISVAAPAKPEPDPSLPPPPIPARRGGEPIVTQSAVLTTGIWPEQAFDLSVLDGAEGTIEARFKSLALDEGLTISDARLVAQLEQGRITVSDLEGLALGAQLKGRLVIDRAAAGVGLDGALRIGGSETQSADAPAGSATPSTSLSLEFSGRALSPAALMVALKGKGEISLGDVTLTGMGPGPVTETAEAALQGKGPSSGEELTTALKAALKKGDVRLGALKIPLAIADGVMKLDRVTIDSEEGRATFETALDLSTMRVDSAWKIEAKVSARAGEPDGAKIMLPPVSVVYAGKLTEFASIEPTVETGALERELTVRKMERDVDELERLRKLDAAKAMEEQARQRALEAEREKARAEAAAKDDAAVETDAAPVPEAGDGNGAAVDPASAGVPADPALQAERPRPVRKPATTTKRQPDKPVWKPFQLTPY